MRRLTLATALVGSLFALSCTSDQQAPTEPSTAPSFNESSETNRICTPTPADPIQAQICVIFPPRLELLTATAFYVAIKFEKRVGHNNSAKALGIALVNITLELYNRGKLAPGTTWAQVRAFSCDIFTLVGVPDCGGLPTDPPSASVHSTVQVCTSAGCLVRPPDRHSGVQVPAGACPSICTISVNPIPVTFPRQGPLNTFLDQYPLFRLFTLTIPGSEGTPTFNSNVLVGICHLSPGDGGPYAPPNATVEGRLQLARNNESEGIDIFPRVSAPFLFCGDLLASNEEFFFSPSTLRSSHPGWFASAAQSQFRQALLPMLRSFFLPEPAEAAVVGACCLGALTSKLSPWAAVDPETPGS